MISVAALALLAIQAQPPRQTVVRDSTKPDTTIAQRRQAIRRPVTEALRASAFKDSASRDLIARARAARIAQDSTITGYDARVAQRLTVKAAIGSVTMERLAYRHEETARVQWQRGTGAQIDVTGARVSIPPVGMPKVERDALRDVVADPSLIPLPYFPGQEPLWVGQFAARPDVNEHDLVHPLANGAEAYYTYRARDISMIRLANRDTLVVRQVDIRPRESAPNLLVGSVWLDNATGQVVRAAYRLAAPGRANISVSPPDSGRDTTVSRATLIAIQVAMRALIPTMSAEVTNIVVEYQRVRGFWLPRSQVMEGFVKSSFAKVPITIENGFRFESVNETSGLAAITVDTMSTRSKIVGNDTIRSIDQCKTGESRVVTAYKGDSVPVSMRIPCDLDKLVASPDLPASAFAENEDLFGTAQRDALVAQALALTDQGPLRLLRWAPYFQYGVSHTRYNRIEGLSSAIVLEQQLGAGLDVRATGRIATADHRPRGELSFGRSNASRTIRLTGFDRLVPMTDWETPLTFGTSMSAFLFGRDDAFYYRSSGVEVTRTVERGRQLTWRLFSERHTTAAQKTDFSVGGSFMSNIESSPGVYTGLSIGYRASRGLDPRGFRISTDVKVEGAGPTDAATRLFQSPYARGAAEITMTQGFAALLDGALTLGAGTSTGDVPIQRLWYLGGTQTIRGQGPSPALSGNAFWLARGEIARPVAFLRLSAFTDLGWAGIRDNISEVGRPFSGAGLGFSFLDGLARLDIARGIYPVEGTRVSFYLGSRF